ncbi:NAD(P)/FAD-dependent oxidoreductase [Glycocaulis sp.]|uniref:NAD(P)/FAD-dependent oxidoreductase n=1 Tax=Glycocaulis sp. TaxID=1969725 RepID=UPI003F730152
MRNSASRVCIIGAGAAGLALAHALTLRGINTVICDAGKAGQGALAASAGMIAPGAEIWETRSSAHPLAGAFGALARHSAALWPAWAGRLQAQTGIDIGYRASGALLPASPGMAEWLARHGVDVLALDAHQARSRIPGLALQEGALFLPGDAHLSAPMLASALIEAITARGVTLNENARVTRLERKEDGGWRVRLAAGGVIEADIVVLAAGWAAAELHPAAADIYPVKGQALMLDARAPLDWPLLRGGDVYMATKPGGRLLVGASTEPGRSDDRAEPDMAGALLARAARHVPDVADMAQLAHWAGVRPALPGLMPRAGLAEPGLVVSLGAYRHGVMLAPALAEGLAELIAGGRVDDALAPFAPGTVNEGLSSAE